MAAGGCWHDEDAAGVLELQLVESVKIQEGCLQLMEEIRGGQIERFIISDGGGFYSTSVGTEIMSMSE